MKASTFGIGLILLGIMMFAYTGIDFITKKRVVDIGPIKIDREVDHPIQWSPIIGVVLVVGGISLALKGRKERI